MFVIKSRGFNQGTFDFLKLIFGRVADRSSRREALLECAEALGQKAKLKKSESHDSRIRAHETPFLREELESYSLCIGEWLLRR